MAESAVVTLDTARAKLALFVALIFGIVRRALDRASGCHVPIDTQHQLGAGTDASADGWR